MRQEWEYYSHKSDSFADPIFNKIGKDGWEMVSVSTLMMQESPLRPPALAVIVMFKRPLPMITLSS